MQKGDLNIEVVLTEKDFGKRQMLRERMEKELWFYYWKHRRACESWEHGEPVKVWLEDGILCIQYSDESWFHYKRTEGGLEWW